MIQGCGWMVISDRETRHVMPVMDLKAHEESASCWCRPVVEEGVPTVIVHHALDGRERSEPDVRPEYQEKVN
jgi:hypothetical protein